MMASHSSGLSVRQGLFCWTPELATRMSYEPNSLVTSSKTRWMSAYEPTSHFLATTLTPYSSAVSLARSIADGDEL
jgi:hypothetical protein